ncbi:DUF1129 family protein [Streptococcus chenjunshii]|uniref:DUF1129 family protein n=1 Tax=Streptococcus chenjunshii TaxID=2173853 RepID=A0A372KNK8_9STRE|nr:DUF1129 family protein [Streptococcus chenjunshii]AXQ77992.1 DUF1129 family protein [Streptococcus chenjunshii]RFU51763.1 DUF1129 family protein [Streptococcus chenjunshii]RFU53853.1 DUF1129 family protein [Streptococcus chenjunshii]
MDKELLSQLTKKNQEFIHIATHQFTDDGKTDTEIRAILEEALPEILEKQEKSIPARSFLGSPTAWAASFTPQRGGQNKAGDEQQEKNTNPWLMWLDTSLLFLGIVALLNGVLMLFNSNTAATGLLSLLTLGFGAGAVMYATYHFLYRHIGKERDQRPGRLKTFFILGAAMLAFVLVYSATALLPAAANPQLPWYALTLLGGAALALRFYLKRKYNILNALTAQQRQS